MISTEVITQIRHLFHAEHWKVGTIASQLGLHRETVRHALRTDRFRRGTNRRHITDPYLDFIQQHLEKYPRLRATRLFEMLRDRGYNGSVVQLRRVVARLRPKRREAFLRLRRFPAEEAQVDWAHFGTVSIGRALRRLSGFVMLLSYSRALYLEFFFDQKLENFLRGHVRAFQRFGGITRSVLYDNLRTAVLDRHGDLIRFHPRLLELSAHYHFQPRACWPNRPNEKGGVEKAISFVRQSFFAAREFTTLGELNRQALEWTQRVQQRPHPEKPGLCVGQAFEEEKTRLLPLPVHPFDTDLLKPFSSRGSIYVRFDLNDYSIPPEAVGKTLTLAASDTQIRILDGDRLLALHPRSYDRAQRVELPAHREALLRSKRKALGSAPSQRLVACVPESETFLEQAFQRGESVARLTPQLLELLDDYGKDELRAVIQLALHRQTPRISSLRFLLNQRRTATQRKATLPVQMTRRPELADIYIQPHSLESYDELSQKPDLDE
jgi:transposase